MNKKMFGQLMRFGVVGCCAALVHFLVVVLLVEGNWLTPLNANVIAFLIAFQVSYWGHRQWTFEAQMVKHRVGLPKLLLVGVVGFLANQGLFYFFLVMMGWAYWVALLVVLGILPGVTFILSKFWVFRF